MTVFPTSEAVFAVCDELGNAYRAGVALSLDAHAAAAAMLRQAGVDVRIMEEALDQRVANARHPVLRVIEGGRDA